MALLFLLYSLFFLILDQYEFVRILFIPLLTTLLLLSYFYPRIAFLHTIQTHKSFHLSFIPRLPNLLFFFLPSISNTSFGSISRSIFFPPSSPPHLAQYWSLFFQNSFFSIHYSVSHSHFLYSPTIHFSYYLLIAIPQIVHSTHISGLSLAFFLGTSSHYVIFAHSSNKR